MWYDIVRDAAFFLSIAFIVLGIVMTIASRRMKPRWDTNMVAAHTPASE